MTATRLRKFFLSYCCIILIRLIIFSLAQETNDEGLFLKTNNNFSRQSPQNCDYTDLLKNKHVTMYFPRKYI